MATTDNRERETGRAASRPVPEWVASLGVPVWVTSAAGNVVYVNDRAATLFGIPVERCVGDLCSRLVAGCASPGEPFCRQRCPARQAATAGQELEPVEIRIHVDGGANQRWVRMLWIPVPAPEGGEPWLVHCAIDTDRAHGAEAYLRRVAARSRSAAVDAATTDWRQLTRREREILEHLAEDLDLPSIAARLHVSHVTVRNHVQHILAKTNAHSVQEVVARYLLRGRGASGGGAP